MKIVIKEKIEYAVLEISPSKLTSNANVKWLLTEFSRLYKPLSERVRFSGGSLMFTPELSVWWEVYIYKGAVKFYLIVPDKDDIKSSMTRQIMKTWKQANVKEIHNHVLNFDPSITDMSRLSLQHHSMLSLDVQNPTYSPLESLLNAKHYVKDEDKALLQIGMIAQSNSWNENALNLMDKVRDNGTVPRKKGKKFTVKDIFLNIGYMIGLVSEELTNLLGDFFIPGWENDKSLSESLKGRNGEVDSISTRAKIRCESFKTDIRIVATSEDSERRKSIIRALISGFDPLEGDNRLIEVKVPVKELKKELGKIQSRVMTVKMNGDILCSLELGKIINVPDQKAQIEHYNELSLVSHRGEAEVPKEIFVDDGGIPFAIYEDTDGAKKTIYFGASNKNHLCMPKVFIGEPGTGKTTLAASNAVDSFHKGYGVFVVDAADGKLAQRILDRVPPELRSKVKIIDFLNTDSPIGLGWNEIFNGRGSDVIEDLVVEEVLSYVTLVSGTDLNMRAKQWVESAVKVVYTTPDATLQDVENMLNNAEFRMSKMVTIDDPELRADWEYYHFKLKPEERKQIYDEAFRRLAPVIRKKALKNFILQRPKKDADGSYSVDFRKWMDNGYLVLIKANETLGEVLQTALVSFVLAKFNLAMVSREDISNEDDRPPCFLLLDEPDHYIKGSEKWRHMLTRYRKYRCGINFMFHGWQQLKEVDKDLPKIIRKAGPHYVIFQTDEDNLLELKPVIEPEFKVMDVAKGMPQYHAIIRLKMYGKDGSVMPAFMARTIAPIEDRYPKYDNDDLYDLCANELGRPKLEVMNELFRTKTGAEFDMQTLTTEVSIEGDGDLLEEIDEDDKAESNRHVRRVIEHEMDKYISEQEAKGEEIDEDLILEMENLMEEG